MMKYEFWKDENGVSEFKVTPQQQIFLEFSSEKNLIVPTAIELDEPIDYERMRRSIQKVFDTCDAMRFIAVKRGNGYYYKIISNYIYEMKVIEAEGESPEERLNDALKKVNDINKEPIDFFNEVSIKIGFIKVDENCYVFYLMGNPWIGDGTAFGVVLDKIFGYYKDINKKYPAAVQFHDFIKSYYEFEKTERGQKQLEYWKNEIGDYRSIDVSKAYEGQRAHVKDFLQTMEKDIMYEASEKYNTSMYNVALCGYHIAIHKFFDVEDSAIGIADACRTKKEVFYTVGYLVRQSQHRLKFDDTWKISDLLETSVAKFSKAVANHNVSSMIHSTQFVLSYNNYRKKSDLQLKSLSERVGNDERDAKEFLCVTLVEGPSNINLVFHGDKNYTVEFYSCFGRYMNIVADLLVHNPDATVGDVQKIFLEKR